MKACQLCGKKAGLQRFGDMEVCKNCYEAGQQFLEDCTDLDMLEAEEMLDNLSIME